VTEAITFAIRLPTVVTGAITFAIRLPTVVAGVIALCNKVAIGYVL